MANPKMKFDTKKVDTKEFELPETHFVRDIENRVFQGIILECLSKIEGITLVEGNIIDSLFGRGSLEGVKGIYVEQDNKNHSVGIKIEVNICYGYSIPEKAEEIQTLCSEEITKLTGLHVSYVHVVFKSIAMIEHLKRVMHPSEGIVQGPPVILNSNVEEEYTDEF